MFRDDKLEIKVGLFIGIGIFLMFFIVFSISDLYLWKDGYNFFVNFKYVNGITEDAPVRLAGVHVGEVKDIQILYNDEGKTSVKLKVWLNGDSRVETDAVARINTLGLLGEQYLEITPGSKKEFLKEGDIISGSDPVNVGKQMETMTEFIASAKSIVQRVERGEGTLGKFLVDESVYDNLSIITDRLKRGEGTIGKFLVEETVYDNVEYFTEDIKNHPWKLLSKPSKRRKNTDKGDSRGTSISTR